MQTILIILFNINIDDIAIERSSISSNSTHFKNNNDQMKTDTDSDDLKVAMYVNLFFLDVLISSFFN